MSENNSFAFVSPEVANEVLETVASNGMAVMHLTVLCGYITFRYGEDVYLIYTPKGYDLLLHSQVVQILDAVMLQESGVEIVGCGKRMSQSLAHFLNVSGVEDIALFSAITPSVNESISDEDASSIPPYVQEAISHWFQSNPMVLSLQVQRTEAGIELTVDRLEPQPNPFSEVGGLFQFIGPSNGDARGLLQFIGAGSGDARDLLQFIGSGIGDARGGFDMAEFLSATGIKPDAVADESDGEGSDSWLAQLEEAEQDFDFTNFAGGPSILNQGEDEEEE